MQEILKVLLQLSEELKEVKTALQSLKKSPAQAFKETWIDGQDVSVALNVSQRTLQTLRTNGLLPFSQFNGKCYYKVSDLETLLNSNYSRNQQSKRHD
ncbi:MAG TPA: DNA-binding protein [Prolixibacteraceae bacterium]|jgi:hypothetical protein|nr:DNA-binding protein [Prolixibacteraceae bacterium]